MKRTVIALHPQTINASLEFVAAIASSLRTSYLVPEKNYRRMAVAPLRNWNLAPVKRPNATRSIVLAMLLAKNALIFVLVTSVRIASFFSTNLKVKISSKLILTWNIKEIYKCLREWTSNLWCFLNYDFNILLY